MPRLQNGNIIMDKIGRVKMYDPDKGFGFIARLDEETGDWLDCDIFFHITDCDHEFFPTVTSDVQFEVGSTKKGSKAVRVSHTDRVEKAIQAKTDRIYAEAEALAKEEALEIEENKIKGETVFYKYDQKLSNGRQYHVAETYAANNISTTYNKAAPLMYIECLGASHAKDILKEMESTFRKNKVATWRSPRKMTLEEVLSELDPNPSWGMFSEGVRGASIVFLNGEFRAWQRKEGEWTERTGKRK